MPLVVELEQRGAVGVVLLQVQVVELRLGCGVAAVFADVHLKRAEDFVNTKSGAKVCVIAWLRGAAQLGKAPLSGTL